MSEQRDPRSSAATTEKVAREYVDKQLETMKRYGSAPASVSDEEYRGLVAEIADAILELRGSFG
jgi:hypothetical protein